MFEGDPTSNQDSPKQQPLKDRSSRHCRSMSRLGNEQMHVGTDVVPNVIHLGYALGMDVPCPSNAVQGFPLRNHMDGGQIEVFHQAHARANLSGPHVQVKGALAVFVGQGHGFVRILCPLQLFPNVRIGHGHHLGGCGVRTMRKACEKCRAAWKRTRLGLSSGLDHVRAHGSPHLQKGLKLTRPPRLKGIRGIRPNQLPRFFPRIGLTNVLSKGEGLGSTGGRTLARGKAHAAHPKENQEQHGHPVVAETHEPDIGC